MRLRYPDVPLKAGHYESVYAVLVHPDEPRALWVRTTVKKRPGEEPTGAVWVTWFDESGVRAGKLDAQPLEPGSDRLTCGPAAQGPSGSRGAIGLDGLSAEWDLAFEARSKPLEHLRPAFLYGAALPKTKATSPAPDVDVSGSLVVDGSTVDLAGWTGMIGHNWGSQHAARWVWLRVCGLGDDGAGWLDAVLGRVQVGPVLAPWKAFGALRSTAPVTTSAACSAVARTSRCAPTVPGSPWPGPTRKSPSRRPCRSPARRAGSTPTRAATATRSSTARSRR